MRRGDEKFVRVSQSGCGRNVGTGVVVSKLIQLPLQIAVTFLQASKSVSIMCLFSNTSFKINDIDCTLTARPSSPGVIEVG